MKTLVLFILSFVFFIFQIKGQTPYNINNVNGTTITSCNAILYDSGGPTGTYQNSENYTVTFCSGTTDCIQLQFSGIFNLETNYEHLYIYDGNNISANLLADLDGSVLPANVLTSGNCVTIRFTSDGSVIYDGFQMNITCTGTCYVPPPPPTNDDPCTAFPIPVNATCNFTPYTCQNATGTITVPAPSCAFSYAGGDVWFSAVVPASGLLAIQLGVQVMSDAGIAIYSGPNCNTLTEVMCNELTWAMPPIQYLSSSLSLAGQTIWIRVWEPANDDAGIFNICAFEPPPFLEVVTNLYTPQQLVQDVLVTGCLTATNITYTGSPNAIGYFNNGNSMGFSNGVCLSSGNATDLMGYGNATGSSTDLGYAGDATLDAIVSPDNTNDAAILEFDFIPSSDTLKFRFIFGSDEYPEFVFSFNDVFGFFLTGPNPSGPAYNSTNVALVPVVPPVPVSIYNVNNGSSSPTTGPCVNCQFYVDNTAGAYSTSLDGFTVPLTAQALVIPCQVYHIKLAIADVNDGILDSGVLLEGGSFTSGGEVDVDHFSSFPIAGEVLEGCDNYYVFSRLDTTDLTDSLHVQLNISGTAINGTDYTPIPTSFWIHAGEISDTVFYSAIMDNLVEPTEYIVLSLTNGCPCNVTTVTDTIYILNNFNFNPQISNDTLVCSGQPVTITTSVNPNIDPALLTYLWSTGASTTSITVNPTTTTTYYVTINDPCAQDTVMESTVTMVPTLSPTFSVSLDTVCINQPTIITFTGTAGPNAVFQWTFNGGTPTSSTTQGPHNVSWITSGNNALTLFISDNGCTGTTTQNVEILSYPQVTIAPTPAACFGTSTGSVTTTETGQVTPYNYIWNNGSLLQNPTNLSTGNYSVTVSNAYGCSIITSTSISQPSVLIFSATSTSVSCFGGNDGTASCIVNGGTPPYQFIWNDPLNQATQLAANLTAGTYTVTATDNNGCTTTATTTINQPILGLSISASTTDVLCAGSSNGLIEVFAVGGTIPYSYLWNNSETTSQINNVAAGNYSITVTDANGCTISNSWTISEPVALAFSGSATPTTCYGISDGSITFNVNNGTPPYTYHWSNNASTSSLTSVSIGNYQVTVTDANNCTIIAGYTITEPQKVTVSISGNQTICIGQSATLTSSVTGGTAPYTLHWNNGSNAVSITVSPIAETIYELFATDFNQCLSNSTSATIFVNPVITATYTISSSSICIGEGISINVNASGGNGNYIYLLNGLPTTMHLTLYPAQSQSYNIVVQDDCGSPTATLDIPVTVKPLPSINFYADSVQGCVPLIVHFIEVNPSIGQTYLWNFGDGSNNQTSTEKNPTHTFDFPGIFDVDLQVISPNGCKNHFTQINWIHVFPNPESRFIAEPYRASFIKPVIHFINLSSELYSSFWHFGDGDSSQQISPWHTYPATPGYYNVELIAVTEHGCKDTTSLLIEIIDEYTFYAPTAFSPDNDGKNDFFFVLGNGIVPQTFELQVYNRWGGVIWETKNYTDQWDGETSGGKKVPIGTYAWIVHYKDETGILHEYSGQITIIR